MFSKRKNISLVSLLLGVPEQTARKGCLRRYLRILSAMRQLACSSCLQTEDLSLLKLLQIKS